eukprot:TRINITY_DN22833_c0_g2_i2.p1 TRINITY_DN22833_c0_g2~~TRINITY_DN22833_c0_g2_i2.p1  ORF type:complete len:322 (+),score=51.92 TRINITY_DN22833_c0_g2_i2:122-1087(+)
MLAVVVVLVLLVLMSAAASTSTAAGLVISADDIAATARGAVTTAGKGEQVVVIAKMATLHPFPHGRPPTQEAHQMTALSKLQQIDKYIQRIVKPSHPLQLALSAGCCTVVAIVMLGASKEHPHNVDVPSLFSQFHLLIPYFTVLASLGRGYLHIEEDYEKVHSAMLLSRTSSLLLRVIDTTSKMLHEKESAHYSELKHEVQLIHNEMKQHLAEMKLVFSSLQQIALLATSHLPSACVQVVKRDPLFSDTSQPINISWMEQVSSRFFPNKGPEKLNTWVSKLQYQEIDTVGVLAKQSLEALERYGLPGAIAYELFTQCHLLF